VTVHLDTIIEEKQLGRFCIESGGRSNSGEESLPGGIVLHWEHSFAGDQLCLCAKACKDFGAPVGKVCTPEERICVNPVENFEE